MEGLRSFHAQVKPAENRPSNKGGSEVESRNEWFPFARVYDPMKMGSINGVGIVPHDNGVIRALNVSDFILKPKIILRK